MSGRQGAFLESQPRFRWRRRLIVLSSLLALWGVIVAITSGISVHYGPIALSSRSPRNPLILALLFAGAAWAMAPAGHRKPAILEDWAWLAGCVRVGTAWLWRASGRIEAWLIERVPPTLAPILAGAVALGVVTIGFAEGAFVAGGADAWGYVSQADLWASGSLRVEQPLMRELSVAIPREALAPLAYRPAEGRMELVPAVAPGLPMLMALFALAGGRDAVFYVLPLMAGLAVAGAYLIAAQLGGRWSGLVAAALLAASPSFLFQLTAAPMSDIPVATWWALALAGLLAGTRRASLAAGLAAGAAMLTRPNLAPLAAVACLLPLWHAWTERSWRGDSNRRGAQRLLLFVAGTLPAVAAIAMVHTFWYGSPVKSGYGSVSEIYAWANLGPNLARYPRWLLESQTPLILLAAVAPFVARQRAAAVTLLVFCLGVLAGYITYIPFDVWWYLRFLLSAYPPLLALTAVALVAVAARLPHGARIAAVAIVVALTVRHGIAYAGARATFDTGGEMKYAITGRYVAEHLPTRAVLFTMLHSGSIRYYSGRTTIRWDVVPYDKFDWTVAEIERHGYVPYAVVEDWEEETWRQRAGREIAALSRPPVATLPLGNIRIYDLRNTAR